MSWATPQKLHPFPATSPFHGLAIPDDVTVSRQILAEPSQNLAARSWATLADGTPLVTAMNIGRGVSILFHVPPQPEWSNLPLSGLFVEMLRRIVELGGGVPEAANFSALAPEAALDAFGDEIAPGPAALPVAGGDFSSTTPGPRHPPGFYGAKGFRHAFNLGAALGPPASLSGVSFESYGRQKSGIELRPFCLAAAFILLLLDLALSLYLRGLINPVRAARAGMAILLLAVILPASAHAARPGPVELTAKTWLAYIETGDPGVDRVSRDGLKGLARVLGSRTSVNNVGVIGVDPSADDLAFFPLIYWPLTPAETPLAPAAAHRVNDYLHHGGMILFDSGIEGETLSPQGIRRLLNGVDIPPLERIPPNHVLHRTFYLLDRFPGRFAGGALWLEPAELSSYDGVATVIAGSGDWAGAWAIDTHGNPLYPCVPGGEAQREQAFRFGINIVMYALTGNYKSDQLHVEALLRREGK
jgi:Domain of unknown function (DUF4159)